MRSINGIKCGLIWKILPTFDEGRERWHRFLREDRRGHEAALPKIEEVFQGIWKDTRERER